MKLPLHKLTRRKPKRIRHSAELCDGIIQFHKLTVFQPVILLFQPVAVENVLQFLQRNILRGDLQIHQITFKRNPDSDAELFMKPECIKCRRTHNRSGTDKLIQPVCQKPVYTVGILRAKEETVLSGNKRKITMYQLQNISLADCVAPAAGFETVSNPVKQIKDFITVSGFCTAQRGSVDGIQIKGKLCLREKITGDHFRIRFGNIAVLPQNREHIIIKL